ncbi:MAG: GIY-YIG nuclease family protein [Deltaproteobacteria bacterium]|nr:GIY-YIG nuclease family protein [Deltaproteobacteria bacterium]
MDKRQWVVYLTRCSDESLYCGITNNLKKRLALHNSGKGAKYTRSRRPVELVGASSKMTKSDALKLEYQVKKVPSSKKVFELIKKEEKEMKNLKKDLQAVNKGLNALANKIEKMIAAVDKVEKPKSAPAKPVMKAAAKLVAKKTVGKVTAADTVLAIIKRRKKGVDTAALMEKTGFNKKKVSNIVFKLRKLGQIKSESKGVYVKV